MSLGGPWTTRVAKDGLNQQHFAAPTERTPSSSRESAGNVHAVVATMIGGGLGGLRSLAAVALRKLAPFRGADGAAPPNPSNPKLQTPNSKPRNSNPVFQDTPLQADVFAH
jgi:hypothetical protein